MSRTRIRLPVLVAAVLLAPLASSAQTVSLRDLPCAREIVRLATLDGRLYAGLANGGLLVFDADGTLAAHWTTVDGLAGDRIADLAWSGEHFWVASIGAGLTRVDPTPGAEEFRLFTNLGDDLALTSVTAAIVGGSERVYFGLEDGGVGVISGGLSGIVMNTDNTPGLVSDDVLSLLLDGADLWIGTDSGVSLLRDNDVVDAGGGLDAAVVNCLRRVTGVGLLAGTNNGVWLRDADAGVWTPLGSLAGNVIALADLNGSAWALTSGVDAADRLATWTGASWTTVDAPLADVRALAAGERLWCGGSRLPVPENYKARQAWIARRSGTAWNLTTTDAPYFISADGLAFGADGSLWFGDHYGAGFGRLRSDGTLDQVVSLAATAPDSIGLFDVDGGVLSMAVDASGSVWLTKFQSGGVQRYRPGLPDMDFLTRDDSGLSSNRILRLLAHPDGPVLMLSDRFGVDVLVDPEHWRDPDSWIHPPTDNTGLGGSAVFDAGWGRPDRIWFAVSNVGLVRWDVNGAAGPDEPLTWSDSSDDVWSEPIASVVGSSYDFTSARAIAVAGDGTLWVGGGSGVAHLGITGEGAVLTADILHSFREKTDPVGTGLMQGAVLDVELDRNDDLWIAHAAGIERIRVRDEGVSIDPFTSSADYAAYGLDAVYTPAIVAGLPGGTARELASNADGSRLAAGTDGGLVRIDVGRRDEIATGPLDPLFLYPNPLIPGEHAGLRLGGITAVVANHGTWQEGGADVAIYNVAGQLVFAEDHVASDDPFWNGVNSQGEPVAPGTYLVRVRLSGKRAVLPLAVVR